jgi:hypothetical protein
VLDAIANNATLSLAGGNVAGFADMGTWTWNPASTKSSVRCYSTEFRSSPEPMEAPPAARCFRAMNSFRAPGLLTVIPEPGALSSFSRALQDGVLEATLQYAEKARCS